MTLYEKILTFNVDDMAIFIQEIVNSTEERLLQDVSKQGYEVSLVRIHPDVQFANNLKTLLTEFDDV